MFFITNRFPTQSIRTRIGRNFTFDLDDNAPSNSVFFCSREGSNRYNEIGSRDFLNRLKQTECGQILIYIHGFSNLPEDVFKDAQEFQDLCNRKKKNDVLVIPMIWPCDNDLGIVGDYRDDQKAADQSAYSFARVL